MTSGGFTSLRRRFRMAFERAMELPVGHVGTCLLWKSRDGRPQVLEMFCYQDGYRHHSSPPFFRAQVNFRPPEQPVTGFWDEEDEVDTHSPNAHIEITVLPEEALALADWLPLWLKSRDGIPVQVPPPPEGLSDICRWDPKLQHVYLWSKNADKAYTEWKERQPCHQ